MEYIETDTNGSTPGAFTRAAVRVPKRLTANSPKSASTIDFASTHSIATRSVNLAMAVLRRASSRPAVLQGAGSTSDSCPSPTAVRSPPAVERHPRPFHEGGPGGCLAINVPRDNLHAHLTGLPIPPCSRRPRSGRRPSRRTPRRTRGTVRRWRPRRVGPACPAGGGSPASPASADRRSATW